MTKRTERMDSRYTLFIPALLVLFCVPVVYACNGIFPFGTESIVHDDMGQCNVPMLYSVWDALHGNGSILLNLRTAGGVFISGAYENILSPVNVLLFLCCPRSGILHAMSFFLLLKMMLAATTAMVLFRYRFTLSAGWNVVLSVLYAFNPFILQYYSNASWLEIVWVAPLVLLGADRLLRGKGDLVYILSLAYCLIVQLYIGYMVLLFLFLNGAMYIFLLLPKKKRKTAAVRFGMSTVLAALLSAVSALPSFFYMTDTSRFQNTRSYAQVLVSTARNPVTKLGMVIILTALPFALALLCLVRVRKKRNVLLYLLFVLFLFLIPVVFENVNLMWHMGSYVSFSMRYAFLFHLMLLLVAGYGLDQFSDRLFCGNTPSFVFTTASAIGSMLLVVLLMHEYVEGAPKGVIYDTVMIRFLCVFVILFFVYLLLLAFGHKRVSCVLIGICVLGEIGFYFNRSVTSGSSRSYEYSLDYISECDTIRDTLPLERDGLTRIKNVDGTLNSNYPLIIDYPSMSNFTHTIPSSIKSAMTKLGYSGVYTRVLDTGGTLFIDALLGFRYALSLSQLSEDNYTFIGESGSYQVYESRFAAPFGAVCSAEIASESFFGKSAFQTMNRLWHTVQDSERDLMVNPEPTETKEGNSATYEFDVQGNKELYLVCAGSSKRKNMQIYVNGELVHIPSLGETENTRYTTRFQNNLLDLGTFTDTHVSIRVVLLNNTISLKKLQTQIALLDKPLLEEYVRSVSQNTLSVHADRRKVTASVTSDRDDRWLFLPLTYDDGWSCRVNGETVKPTKALGTFMAIPLQTGNNEISLSYMPKGFVIGSVISLFACFAVAAWIFLEKDLLRFMKKTKLASVIWSAYFVADCGVLAALYVVPILCKLFLLVKPG